jgi:CRP-like cAMP-binding protein
MAFLLEQPRSRDVFAATDGTRVLSLSDGHLRRLIDREPRAAALLLMNLSRMLCFRLITQV